MKDGPIEIESAKEVGRWVKVREEILTTREVGTCKTDGKESRWTWDVGTKGISWSKSEERRYRVREERPR